MESTQALSQFAFLFAPTGGYVRIPIWGHIPLSQAARAVIEHPDFVRLAKIRQLGLVYYVFPGASHTRFEHSIGAYHLSVLMLQRLVQNPANWHDEKTPKITPDEARLFLAAALLHDIGHYPLAHLVDKLPGQEIPNSKPQVPSPDSAFAETSADKSDTRNPKPEPWFLSHEDRARAYILGDQSQGSIYAALKEEWGIANPEQVADIIAHPMESGLPGRMLSGILDPDKMDYLMRDANACAVPYGNIDTDRLIESIVLDIEGDHPRLGITEKGIAPLESLVFAKYMMFRHIYWHHAVRIAAAMCTRYVQDALGEGLICPSDFYELSDDALMEKLGSDSCSARSGSLMADLKNRTLYKRGFTLYPESAVGGEEFSITGGELERVKALYRDPEVRRQKEEDICRLLNRLEGCDLAGHEVLLDIPRVSSVFDVDDFENLRVFVRSQTGGEGRFVLFGSAGVSQLTAEFAQQFERYSRRVQVICRPDLREAVLRRHAEIKAIAVG